MPIRSARPQIKSFSSIISMSAILPSAGEINKLVSEGTTLFGSRKKDKAQTKTAAKINSIRISSQHGKNLPSTKQLSIAKTRTAGNITTCGKPYFVKGILMAAMIMLIRHRIKKEHLVRNPKS